MSINQSDIKTLIGNKIKDPSRRPFAVIMKCTEKCNYQCNYCYVEKRSTKETMEVETAKLAISKILEFVGKKRKVNLIWHGGEPLSIGRDFFETVARHCEEYSDYAIENCIQTNGYYLKEDILNFLDDKGFLISISIDGPESLHDKNRINTKGQGTFGDVMKAANLLRAKNGYPACVSVLHKGNVDQIDEIYRFFKEEGIHFRINPVVKSGRAINAYNDLAITPQQYGAAMCRLFDLWFEDECQVQVEPLHTIMGNFISPTVWGCDYHGGCLENIISINPDGSMYPCGRFAGMEEYKLGNIHDNSIEEIYSNKRFQELMSRTPETVPGCAECDFVEICNAGCMITAHMAQGNIHDKDYYCDGRKMLFRHIAMRLDEHLDAISVGKIPLNSI